jgi:hypothetical protein
MKVHGLYPLVITVTTGVLFGCGKPVNVPETGKGANFAPPGPVQSQPQPPTPAERSAVAVKVHQFLNELSAQSPDGIKDFIANHPEEVNLVKSPAADVQERRQFEAIMQRASN